ncbi:glutathione S-transferase family protein [Tabrizicola sp.]|jgi:glutathione S-transferase|uniref:glutathione S-transferase family protein n=1 Tax=Tabrizicola sp. TaxID=2005166 RepID=UPI0035B2EE43
MLTLFHSPQSRSSAIMVLIEEMGIADRIEARQVSIPRIDGTGHRDPANPHPEGKVPALVHDDQLITERGAIILHLTTLFPDTGLSPRIGTPEWGKFVSWLTWYQGVLEPVVIFEAAGLSHPWLEGTFRDHKAAAARIRSALEKGPWLLGDEYSAADLLIHGPYAFFPDATPDDPLIRDWVARCKARPARQRVIADDLGRMAA